MQGGQLDPIPAGSKYCLVLVDDYTGMAWVNFYAHKNQFREEFVQFKAMVETQTGRKDKRVQSDQALEFHSNDVAESSSSWTT